MPPDPKPKCGCRPAAPAGGFHDPDCPLYDAPPSFQKRAERLLMAVLNADGEGEAKVMNALASVKTLLAEEDRLVERRVKSSAAALVRERGRIHLTYCVHRCDYVKHLESVAELVRTQDHGTDD